MSGADPAESGPAAPPPAPVPPFPPSPPHPTSAWPYPTSVAPYPTSVAPYPTSVAPYPAYAMSPPKPRLSAWVWVLAAVCPILLVVAGGFAYRYWSVRAANEQAITQRAEQIEELNEALRRLATERENLDEEQAAVLAALADVAAQIHEHQACPNAVLAFDDALGSGTEAEQDAAFEGMVVACDVTL